MNASDAKRRIRNKGKQQQEVTFTNEVDYLSYSSSLSVLWELRRALPK